jgi:DNA recombination protein RmuC
MIIDFNDPSLADLLRIGVVTLLAVCVAVLVLLYRRPKYVEPLTETLDTLRHDVQRLDQALQASELKAQDAADGRDSRLRRELAEALTGAIRMVSDQQHQKMESVENRLILMSEAARANADRLRETLERSLQSLREDNTAKLEQMRLTVDEKLQSTLEKRLAASFQSVSDRLESVHKGLGEMQTLATGVGDLKKMLSGVKTRGTFGEEQLGALLEQFLAPSQIERNARTRPGSAETVEFAIRLPEGVLLPIDSKFPQEDYERLQAAAEIGDVVSVEAASIALERRLREEAKKIASKYVNPPVTTDFAVMFVPTEGLFAEIVRRPGLREQIQRTHRVTVLGPTVLGAFLSSLNMGFRTLAIQQKSAEVWQVLGAVKTEFAKYGDMIDKVGKKLGESQTVLSDIGTRTRVIQSRLREVEALPEAGPRRPSLESVVQGDLLGASDTPEEDAAASLP